MKNEIILQTFNEINVTDTVNGMSSHAFLNSLCSFRLVTSQEDPERGPLGENPNLSESGKIIKSYLEGK